jgi:hypothetical protein
VNHFSETGCFFPNWDYCTGTHLIFGILFAVNWRAEERCGESMRIHDVIDGAFVHYARIYFFDFLLFTHFLSFG